MVIVVKLEFPSSVILALTLSSPWATYRVIPDPDAIDVKNTDFDLQKLTDLRKEPSFGRHPRFCNLKYLYRRSATEVPVLRMS